MKKSLLFVLLIAVLSSCKKSDPQASQYEVNSTTSKIAWLGSAIDHYHIGAFALSGNVTTSGTTVTGGDFTMIGETHQLSFPAKISITGDSLTTVATFNLDRTQWGMTIYNDSTQKNYIYPAVGIDLEIQAGKTK